MGAEVLLFFVTGQDIPSVYWTIGGTIKQRLMHKQPVALLFHRITRLFSK
jgi:hypothetical protein